MCNQSNSLVDETFSETTQLKNAATVSKYCIFSVFILSAVQWKNTDTDTNRKNAKLVDQADNISFPSSQPGVKMQD